MERLQKVLAHSGIASRRKCEELIKNGRVHVNGKLVRELGLKVDPDQDVIKVDKKRIQIETSVYYIFHKPTGVITSVTDPQKRKVVTDFFINVKERIYPVGRLDYDTSGLLILTNDGQLTNQLMHPAYEIEKTYLATVEGIPSSEKLAQLRSGVHLVDGWTAPAQAELITKQSTAKESVIRLTIHEGRNRQVRRMCKRIGHPVKKLHREKYGFLTLKGIKQGEYRTLTTQEIDQLKKHLNTKAVEH